MNDFSHYLRVVRAVSFTAALLWARAEANPAVAPATERVYLASEQLVVTVSSKDAHFDGVFRFEQPAGEKASETGRLSLILPIWFPEESEDPAVQDFWRTFQRGPNLVTARNGDVFERAVGLKMTIGKEQRRVEYFDVVPRIGAQPGVEAEYSEPGLRCLIFRFDCPNEVPVTVSYRQPHSVSHRERRFFYLPIFDNLPKGMSTSDTNRYSIRFAAAAGCSLSLTNGAQLSTLQPGGGVVFSPKHRQAIRGVVTAPAVQESLRKEDNIRSSTGGQSLLGR